MERQGDDDGKVMERPGDDAGFEGSTTLAVASTVLIIVLASLVAERCIHRLKKNLKRKNQKPLRKVVDKLTQELMLLGFISLLLTVLQTSVSKICVNADTKLFKRMLPCPVEDYDLDEFSPSASRIPKVGHGRRLLKAYHFGDFAAFPTLPHRSLISADEDNSNQCGQGKAPFVSRETLHELHIFIFVLAATHVSYSAVTMLLGFARLHRWKPWEKETQVEGYDPKQDLERRYREMFASSKSASAKCSNSPADKQPIFVEPSPVTIWINCFFKQFFASVSREDYLAFRLKFIKNHNLPLTFNFWDYVIRSMEVEFKEVIGISWWLWIFVTVFLLINIHGWYTYFWMAFIPTIILMVLGTKQQHVITLLALRTKQSAAEFVAAAKCSPDVLQCSKSKNATQDVSDASESEKVLWFDNPRLLSRVLHFVIFQNSFELAVFLWLVTTFGWNPCVMGNHALLILRVIVGLLTQTGASYSTLPIFALVTQMGSQMKHTVFRKDVHVRLEAWRARVQRRRLQRDPRQSPERTIQSKGQPSIVAPANGGGGPQQMPPALEEGVPCKRQSPDSSSANATSARGSEDVGENKIRRLRVVENS